MSIKTDDIIIEQQGKIIILLERLVKEFDDDRESNDETPSMMDTMEELLKKYIIPLTERTSSIETHLNLNTVSTTDNDNGRDIEKTDDYNLEDENNNTQDINETIEKD